VCGKTYLGAGTSFCHPTVFGGCNSALKLRDYCTGCQNSKTEHPVAYWRATVT
jgi:hypothetical protein